jgi:conjugative relaxase-like TrwC/TraI family protein
MLTMSKALPAGQAIDYYRREYTSASESYSNDQLSGEWHGHLAEEWNLRGTVEGEQYERLCEGLHPDTGEQLVRHAPARTYENKYGDVITSSEHRAGWDLTFSAPKSASLAAVAGGDERVRQAHRESVDKALDEVERYTQARIGGNHPAETTGRMVAAKFDHDAARPSRATGYAAPQLHTHAVVFNVTEIEDGSTRAVQPFEMYRSQQLATAVYRMNLAERLQQLGYEIEVDRRTGAPEIKGFSAEYLEASSPRSAEIKQEAELMKARLEADGATVKEGAGLKQAAARADRAGKEYDRAAMKERVMEMEERYGLQAQRLYEQSLERGPLGRSQEEEIIRAREAVASAREMAVEQGPDVDIRQVWIHALKEGTSLTTFDAVKAEMEESVAKGEFLGLVRESQRSAEVTNSMTPTERVDGLQLNDHERESEIEKAGQSLSARSLDQNSVPGSSQAGDSFGNHGGDSLSTSAEDLADDLEIENAFELGFGL